MAHKKAGGSTKLGRDSQSQRLGVKVFGGENILAGAIIIRQRGTKYHPGLNVGRGKDDTLFALKPGVVEFREKKVPNFTGNRARRMFVSINETLNLKPQISKLHLKN